MTLASRPRAEPVGAVRDGVRLAAVATTDPLDERTFSGYSAALFTHLAERGVPVVPVASRQVRARDLLGGAVHWRGILRGRIRGRRAPLVDPDWYWSARVVERLSARVHERIAAAGGITHALQIGTHVCIDRDDVAAYCVTDCTVVQAVESGEFAISRATPAGVRRAVDWQRRVFASCDTVFTTSDWAAASVVDDFDQPAERVVTIGAGATNVGRPDPPGAPTGPPTVLFVGYDWDLKGGPLLLDAWRAVARDVPDARLVIVGCSPRIADAGVEVVGRLDPRRAADRDRLVGIYRSATCLALLSDFDAFPNVILEAGAMGLPVIAFDEQSRREVVHDRDDGVLVASRDVDAVAGALRMLLGDRSTAAAMGRRARERVEAGFTWDAVAARVLATMGVGP